MSEIVAVMSETRPSLHWTCREQHQAVSLPVSLPDPSESESLLDCITADIIDDCPQAKIPDVYVFNLFNTAGVVLMGVTFTSLPMLGIAVCA